MSTPTPMTPPISALPATIPFVVDFVGCSAFS
jgi:hypothetical protein